MGSFSCASQIFFQPHGQQLIGKSLVEIVHTRIPHLTFGLANFPSSIDLSVEVELMVDRVEELHKVLCFHLEEANTSYKARAYAHQRDVDFNVCDLVMVHLKKSYLPLEFILN